MPYAIPFQVYLMLLLAAWPPAWLAAQHSIALPALPPTLPWAARLRDQDSSSNGNYNRKSDGSNRIKRQSWMDPGCVRKEGATVRGRGGMGLNVEVAEEEGEGEGEG